MRKNWLTDDVILGNLQKYLLELITRYSIVSGYKNNIQNIDFIYNTGNKQSEIEIKLEQKWDQ